MMSISRRGHFGALAGLAVAFAIAGGSALSMDWPLSPPRLAATFGTYAKGRIIMGVAFSGDDGFVRSAEDGEVSFCREEGTFQGALPMPLGSFVVIEHKEGMTAVYSHLVPGSLSTYLRKPRAGDILGKPGNSGWIEGSGALFQVFDRRAGAWVNPLLVLPPLMDDKPPIIRSLALSRADKAFVLGETVSVPQGTYQISVDVADPADSSWTVGPLAPYSIRLSIDGAEAAKDVFDIARGTGGELMLFSSSPADANELKTKEGRYSLATRLFTRGRAVIEVRVEDAAGNKRTASWTINVE